MSEKYKPSEEEVKKVEEIMEAEGLEERSHAEQVAFEAGRGTVTDGTKADMHIQLEKPKDLTVEKIKEKIKLLRLKGGDPIEIVYKNNGRRESVLTYFDRIFNDDGTCILQKGRDETRQYTALGLKCTNIVDIKRWLEIP